MRLFEDLGQTPLGALPLPDLASPSKSCLTNHDLQTLLRLQNTTLNECTYLKENEGFVKPINPITVGAAQILSIPTPERVYGTVGVQLSAELYNILGPLLVRAFLEKSHDWDAVCRTKTDAQEILTSLSSIPNIADFSFSGALGWAKYGAMYPITPIDPAAALFQHVTPQIKLKIIELYELASLTVPARLRLCNYPTAEVAR